MYEGYPEIKDKNGWERKGNRRCASFRPCRPQPRPRSQRFQFVFAYKETSVRPDVLRRQEVKNEAATPFRAQAAELCGIGIQKLVPRPNKCLGKVDIMLKNS
jgi:hypothetical protein